MLFQILNAKPTYKIETNWSLDNYQRFLTESVNSVIIDQQFGKYQNCFSKCANLKRRAKSTFSRIVVTQSNSFSHNSQITTEQWAQPQLETWRGYKTTEDTQYT